MTSELQPAPVARQISLRAVMGVVLHQGPISRAQIAKLTGLSKQTTSEVVRELEQSGWLRVRGQTQGPVGRSAVTYELDDATAFVLGIDLGGTKLHAALANLAGRIVAEAAEATDGRGGLAVIEQIGRLAEQLAAEAGVDRAAIRGGVMGSPGVFQPATGAIAVAPNVPGLDRIDVAGALERRLGFAVAIENDVNLAAKGEQWQGQGRGTANFAFIALGTGVGMGIVADGRLLHGQRGGAGEIAYLPLGLDPFDPRGFRLGALETAVGSVAIAERYAGYGGRPGASVRDVFEALAQDDPAAAAAIEETARLIAPAIAAVAAILDPERVILGGSIGARPELANRVRRLLPRCTPMPPRLEISALGNRAALVGAVGMALSRLHHDLFGLDGLPGDLALPAVAEASR